MDGRNERIMPARTLLAGAALARATLAGATLLLGAMTMDCYAQAQQTESASATLDEVVVSARKRDESSLNVPIAINVFTAADVEASGIERPQDFIDLTPNMSMVQTQNQ